MRHKTGIVLMILGTISMLLALSLLIYDQQEAAAAKKASAELMPKLIAQIETNCSAPDTDSVPIEENVTDTTMDTITIDGQVYIGYILIPALNLELPVMSDWSYRQLRTAPCRFSGTLAGDDLVVMAHNYARHFGSLKSLSIGESIYFRDVDGVTTQYEVVAVDILSPTAIEEMTAGKFDLTLFTCTYGGKSRVTVRCNRS